MCWVVLTLHLAVFDFFELSFDTTKGLIKLVIEEGLLAQMTLFSSVKCKGKLQLHFLRFDRHRIHSSMYLFTNLPKIVIDFFKKNKKLQGSVF